MTNTKVITIGLVVIVLIAVIGFIVYKNRIAQEERLSDERISDITSGIGQGVSNQGWLEKILNSQFGKGLGTGLGGGLRGF